MYLILEEMKLKYAIASAYGKDLSIAEKPAEDIWVKWSAVVVHKERKTF